MTDAICHYATFNGPDSWSVWTIRSGYYYAIRVGDRFEYDQYLEPSPQGTTVAGADFFYCNEFRFSLAGLTDQHGNGAIADVGCRQWVRRAFDLSPLAGQTVMALASQINGLGPVGARYANVSITNPATQTRYVLYSHGAIAAARSYGDQNVADVVVRATSDPRHPERSAAGAQSKDVSDF